MLKKAGATPGIPRIGLGTHSTCNEAGNALQEKLLREFCLNPDWAQLNDWEYGAYRYEATHGEVRKIAVNGATATFEATRFAAVWTGDAIPLSLKFAGAQPVSARTADRTLVRELRGTWTLPHAQGRERLHGRIARADEGGVCQDFPGLRVAVEPDEAAGRLVVRVMNQTGCDLRELRVVAAFPPKWTVRANLRWGASRGWTTLSG